MRLFFILMVVLFHPISKGETHSDKKTEGSYTFRHTVKETPSSKPKGDTYTLTHTVRDTASGISAEELATLKNIALPLAGIKITEESGVVSICDDKACGTFKSFAKAKKYLEDKVSRGNKKDTFKMTVIEQGKSKPTITVPDVSGRAYTVSGMEHLERVVQRNRAAGVTTRVIFAAINCGPCQQRKPGFIQEAASAPANVRYYIYEIPDYNAGIQGNAVIGSTIPFFPTERDL